MAYNTHTWNKPCRAVLYCQLGSAVDLADFSINNMLQNVGIDWSEYELFFITWKSSPAAHQWIKDYNFKSVEMEYDEGRGFLWNLYKGWNLGYEIGFQYADYVVPIATDHAYGPAWLCNLLKRAEPNRIVNCKLIEPGTQPTLHQTHNFGITTQKEFQHKAWKEFSDKWYDEHFDEFITDEKAYGHRLDAMPMCIPKDVWQRFGPMSQIPVNGSPDPDGVFVNGVTGDTDFMSRAKSGGVEFTKAIDALSYHCGGLETARNIGKGVYT